MDKSASEIDLQAETATCPAGHTVSARSRQEADGHPILLFTFPRAVCENCSLFARCVRSKTRGRTVRTHAYEAYLQAQRQRQQSNEFKQLYRTRSQVERKVAELSRRGIRHTRYLGEKKRHLQRLWTGAAVNLKHLFHLTEARGVDLHQILSLPALHQRQLKPT